MVCVPAGEFWMGAAQGDGQAEDDERPGRMVFLDAYWIDRFEVTNSQYQACVNANGCSSPGASGSMTRGSYYGNPSFANYPVIYVDWYQANAYCEWAGERLPSEAQWEKAARGTDGRIYPWGNEAPNSSLANSKGAVGDTLSADSNPNGKSPYGAYNMAGNVWEWVVDWHSASYYQSSPANNPTGPASGSHRVIRGGSWSFGDWNLRASNRGMDSSSGRYDNLGFRCILPSN